MSDPNRLLDDPTLSPLARSVLRSADGDHPGAGRRRVAAAIGISALSGAAASAATATAGLWWKVPLVVLGLVGAGTTAYVVTRPGPDAVATAPSTPPPVKAPAPTPDIAVAAVTPPAVTPPAITPPAITPPAITRSAPTPATHPSAPRV